MLQEVFTAARPRLGHMSLIVADCTEQLECGFKVVSNLTDGGQVTASVTIIRRTPDGHDVLVGEVVFVSLVDKLVSSSDQGEVIDVTEFISYTISE